METYTLAVSSPSTYSACTKKDAKDTEVQIKHKTLPLQTTPWFCSIVILREKLILITIPLLTQKRP